ncbi:MAG: hypothetical protein SP1CHLAM54_05580 [Chlamydiia bacterium]|nr:hypothetical protein [Chlamydiia bacterium]MCH9615468.1 hypothetical protein [Chlamydiia bacterium]MCH9629123.1 hypothetical protein [Chlamydiia bacterium]
MFLLLLPALLLGKTVTYTFNEEVSGETLPVTWTYEKTKEGIVLQGKERNSKTIIDCYSDLTFHKVTINDKLFYYREGNMLFATTPKGKRSYKLGKTPWIQQFWFGLIPFVQSTDERIEFYVVNPRNLDLVRLKAIKRNVVKLTLDGKTYDALRIKITLPGFKGAFWKAYIFFDMQTSDFLKYVGNSGPGTPTETITFVKRKE